MLTFKNRVELVGAHDVHEYNTRGNDIRLPLPRLELYRLSPKYQGIRLYNLLPVEVKSMENIGQFKRALKNILTENVFYTVQEYVENINGLKF